MKLAACLLVSTLLALPSATVSRQAPPRDNDMPTDGPNTDIWLKENGFLNEGDSVKEALIKAQKAFHMKPTGMLDDGIYQQMLAPRCGSSDNKDDKVPSRKRRYAKLSDTVWKNRPVTISFQNYLQSATISQRDQEDIAMECAKRWADVSSLSFTKAPYGETGNIAINFKRIDGPYNTVGMGLSASPPSSYLTLDIDEPWVQNRPTYGQGVSLTWAICHEMGHTLSLGHSSDENAIMYPSHVNQDDTRLNADDIYGIQMLYGGPRTSPEPRQNQPPPPSRTSVPAQPKRTIPTNKVPASAPRRTTVNQYQRPRQYTPQQPQQIRSSTAQFVRNPSATPFWKFSSSRSRRGFEESLGDFFYDF